VTSRVDININTNLLFEKIKYLGQMKTLPRKPSHNKKWTNIPYEDVFECPSCECWLPRWHFGNSIKIPDVSSICRSCRISVKIVEIPRQGNDNVRESYPIGWNEINVFEPDEKRPYFNGFNIVPNKFLTEENKPKRRSWDDIPSLHTHLYNGSVL